MNDDLAQRIRRVYPDGLVDEWNEAALEDGPRDERLRAVLQACAAECGLNFDIDFTKGKRAYVFHLTEKFHPEFQAWVWQMDNAAKIAWIQKNGGPFPVLLLEVSRVADYYHHFFNHWLPRGESGYLDVEIERPINVAWTARVELIQKKLAAAGFQYLTTEFAREKTPFVQERDYDAIPDDDPRWDEDGFEPPLVPTTVHECLFSH